MSEAGKPVVVATLEDDTGDRCVDILRHDAGHYTYVEYHRDPEDAERWWRQSEGDGPSFPSEYAAYAAAIKAMPWLID